MISTLAGAGEIITEALETILSGGRIATDKFFEALRSAGKLREGRCFLEEVSGGTLVIGPCRGHATDLAHYLRGRVLEEIINDRLNVVFLGNYVDGGHKSMEVLYLVALMVQHLPGVVVPLIGRHEMFYPFPPGHFGSLKAELHLRSVQYGIPFDLLEQTVKNFFAKLPVACVVDKRFFCSSSGLASEYRRLNDIRQEVSQSRLSEFVLNQPMDEDEEKLSSGWAFVGSRTETGSSLRYTFNAASNFLARNGLYTHIGGLEYHMYRPEFENFARSNHYAESTYFPGWLLGRIHHEFRVPASIMIFSASRFCGINQNYGCVVAILGGTLELRQFGACVRRPLIMPGEEGHAFSWSLGLVETAVRAILNDLLFADIPQLTDDDGGKARDTSAEETQKITSRYRRMCQLLKSHALPMPR
ncbi:kinetoplastid-specific phospho-protein phosphatase [Trypanosoma conorhini]|uniref:Kinetoplastid-specific phospho-protein phosphatase n=1 Tax=Trypanosoma conorhini TaxID=83891 RepID=A0A422PDL5_9TRYP|nr:kinetoplastid-specific phospho-protein phosphatase [Trypanosoma conorhini]RNF15811.1 kinetoplastid-specific phospho-protein phosphatase [Trypanosoma conorhini]